MKSSYSEPFTSHDISRYEKVPKLDKNGKIQRDPYGNVKMVEKRMFNLPNPVQKVLRNITGQGEDVIPSDLDVVLNKVNQGTQGIHRSHVGKKGKLHLIASMINAGSAPGNPLDIGQGNTLDMTDPNNLIHATDLPLVHTFLTQKKGVFREGMVHEEIEDLKKKESELLGKYHNITKVLLPEIKENHQQLKTEFTQKEYDSLQAVDYKGPFSSTEEGKGMQKDLAYFKQKIENYESEIKDAINELSQTRDSLKNSEPSETRDSMKFHLAEKDFSEMLGLDYQVPVSNLPEFKIKEKRPVLNLRRKIDADINVLNEIAIDLADEMRIDPQTFGPEQSEMTLGNMLNFLQFVQKYAGNLPEGHNYHSLFSKKVESDDVEPMSNTERINLKNAINGNGVSFKFGRDTIEDSKKIGEYLNRENLKR